MLTISKPLSSGQAQAYHREEFANAQENYYTKSDQVRGEWHGKLAQEWGLQGEVSQEHFGRLADGQDPFTGTQLVQFRARQEYENENGERVRTMEHRAGWDATFSAPKSVSLTALVGADERVRAAHRESVTAALDELERYVQARIGGNHTPETTGRWIAARFEHDSSRPVDGYAAPQLHTHVVFFNLTERANGDTRALQPQELFRSQQYATAVYRSELALRLKHLGYEIEQSAHGAPEIKGYTQDYLDASSPRRQQIKEHLAEQGMSGAEAAQIAAHRTREAKLNITHEDMQHRHQQMAEEYGNQPERIVREAQARVQQIEQPNEDRVQRVAQQSVDYSIEKNFEREAVSDERDLMRDALKRSMGDAPAQNIRREFEREVEHNRLMQTAQERGPSRSFTTDEMVGLERKNIRLMRTGQDQYPAVVSFDTRMKIREECSHLSNGQRTAIGEVLSSRDQITALEGTAGAGKTTSLAAIRDAAEREGYRVEGFAPTSGAAHKLQESGIQASTLQRHLARGQQAGEAEKHLYVLDESSLASTRQINEFLSRLGEQDRVLLVGDVRQHEAVEAGRPYHQLQEAGMRTAHLDEIVRQKDPALKEAVEQLARGEVREAVHNLDRQGRVQEIENRDDRLQEMALEYARQPERTLVISPDNDSRRELNSLIHRAMQENGQVQRAEHAVRVLEARQDLTGADRAWAEQYQPGDVLRYSRGSKLLGIEAGEYATVTHTEGKQNLLTAQRQDGEQVTYDPRRLQGVSVYREAEREFAEGDRIQFTAPSKELQVANRELGTIVRLGDDDQIGIKTDSGKLVEFEATEHPHLDYGYAMTSHSSQGQTADRVLIHVDTEEGSQLVNSRMAYVAISRGRHDAQIYTDNKAELADQLGRDHSHSTAIGPAQDHHQGHQEAAGPSVGHDAGQESAAHSHGHGQGAAQGESMGE
ncbi:MAG TPA: MobF family relaxase [Verrucomicrobiae bacterium]|jgi:conjugative relaxase-like TrwC/TraI family protein|nr:MobF family relaxase [Verrucomicrobiae bacterium]